MNKEQYLLIKLIEECAEVQQMASKCLIFGTENRNIEDGYINRELLIKEINHIIALIKMIQEIGVIEDDYIDLYTIHYKCKKVKEYSKVSITNGILKEEL